MVFRLNSEVRHSLKPDVPYFVKLTSVVPRYRYVRVFYPYDHCILHGTYGMSYHAGSDVMLKEHQSPRYFGAA